MELLEDNIEWIVYVWLTRFKLYWTTVLALLGMCLLEKYFKMR
jgi:hypothetical protein